MWRKLWKRGKKLPANTGKNGLTGKWNIYLPGPANENHFCTGTDNDTDIFIDNFNYYMDADGDGYGNINNRINNICPFPAGYIRDSADWMTIPPREEQPFVREQPKFAMVSMTAMAWPMKEYN